jgi:hypothetical protein
MLDENEVRKELTIVMGSIPNFIEKTNPEHMICFGYLKECLRVFRKSISKNYLDETSLESLSIDYHTNLCSIFTVDKYIFDYCIRYISIILKNLIKILEKNDLYESCSNLQWILEITDENLPNKK